MASLGILLVKYSELYIIWESKNAAGFYTAATCVILGYSAPVPTELVPVFQRLTSEVPVSYATSLHWQSQRKPNIFKRKRVHIQLGIANFNNSNVSVVMEADGNFSSSSYLLR